MPWSSSYYKAPMAELVSHLAVAEEELRHLETLPQKSANRDHPLSKAGYTAARKRQVIVQLKKAIRSRISWHRAQIILAESAGVFGDDTEPTRSELPPGLGRGKHDRRVVGQGQNFVGRQGP